MTTRGTCTEFQDYPRTDSSRLMNNCVSASGTWSSSACSRTGALGGCRTRAPGSTASSTVWYYDSSMLTPDDVMMECSRLGAEHVLP